MSHLTINPQEIRPPHCILSLFAIAATLHFALRPSMWVAFPLNWLGLGVFVFGIYINVLAARQFSQSKTPVPHNETPKAVVSEGIFKYSRNPMYLGGAFVMLGLAVMIGTWPFFLIWLIMGALLNFVYIPWEEKRMEELFGQQYLDYKEKTRRWI